MRTYTATPKDIIQDWYIIDAQGKALGRLASRVATILRGKHKPCYTPHMDTGDGVIIINAQQIVLTGKKLYQKKYYRHSSYPGGLKVMPVERLMPERSPLVVRLAVKGMLPKNTLGREMLKKLKVYAGTEHPHKAQNPKRLSFNDIPQNRK